MGVIVTVQRSQSILGLSWLSPNAALDAEIARLQHAKTMLDGSSTGRKRRGRPAASVTSGKRSKKRTLSAEARAKIAAADDPIFLEGEDAEAEGDPEGMGKALVLEMRKLVAQVSELTSA
jgi:hypothetical protein